MLRLNKRIDYGILVLSALGSQPDRRVAASEVSERYQLSQHMVANILKALTRAGIVKSGRGVRGGYQLARPAGEIRLLDVLEALEGPFALLDCAVHDPGGGARACNTTPAICHAKPVIQTLNRKLRELLAGITVADFVGPGAAAPPALTSSPVALEA